METSSAVTRRTKANYKSSISPAQSRPFPQLPEKRDKREYARLLRNDAQVAVLVLNASKGKAHERLTIIRRELEELRAETSKLKTIEREIGAEMFPNGNDGPGRSGTKRHLALAAEYKALYDDLNKRHIELNDRLAFYAFRPCVAYTINSDEWRFGIVPDANRRVFQMKVGPFTATEGDAVMSMVRLDASGQLSQVRLCEQCKTVWTVARKIDRFCGKVCREAFYAADSDFLARKAKNQDDYRRREKQKAIDAIANLKNL